MSGRARRTIAAAALAVPILVGLAATAFAEIEGNCSAEINGALVDDRNSRVKSDAIVVPEHAGITVSGVSKTPADHVDIYMEFLGFFEWKVATDTFDPDTNWSSTVQVDKYAKYGVGLYRVRGSTGQCSGAALVRVIGNPLGTVAGVVSAAVAGVGVVALGAATARAARPGASAPAGPAASGNNPPPGGGQWDPLDDVPPDLFAGGPCWFFVLPALLMTGAAMMGAVPAPAPGAKRPSSLRLSFVGIAGGLMAGLGVTALLQQYAILYPTRIVTIVMVAGGAMLGVLLPTLRRRRAMAAVIGRSAQMQSMRAAALEELSAAPPPPADEIPPPPDELPPSPDELPPPPPDRA